MGTALCRNIPSIYSQILLVPDPIQHDIAYNMAATKVGKESITKLTKEIPQIVLTGLLWGVYCERFGKKTLAAFYQTALCHAFSTGVACLFYSYNMLIPRSKHSYSTVITYLFHSCNMLIRWIWYEYTTVIPCSFHNYTMLILHLQYADSTVSKCLFMLIPLL